MYNMDSSEIDALSRREWIDAQIRRSWTTADWSGHLGSETDPAWIASHLRHEFRKPKRRQRKRLMRLMKRRIAELEQQLHGPYPKK